MVAVPLCESDGLTGPISQVIELGPPGFAASDRLNIENVGRMQRKDSFDALITDDPPDREVFVDTPAFAGDYCAGKYLRSLFVAFFNTAMDFDNIAYLEVGDLALKAFALNGV